MRMNQASIGISNNKTSRALQARDMVKIIGNSHWKVISRVRDWNNITEIAKEMIKVKMMNALALTVHI